MHKAYEAIFRRCGLPSLAVEADVGIMGGSLAHEFMYPTEIGEDTIVLCDACGYAKNRQVAEAGVAAPPGEDLQPIEKVATPETTTIDSLVELLAVEPARTAKVLFVAASGGDSGDTRLAVAVVRGDRTVNETKLANALGASDLRPMTDEEIRAIGCVPGYASPIGVGERATVVVDPLVAATPNLVAGANEAGFHLLNVNVGRDYTSDITTDITAAEEGDPCPQCGGPLRTERAVEVGNIFRLGTKFSEAAGARYLDENGQGQPIVMGSYGIGIGRLLACLAEEHRDDKGLAWPAAVAPFDVHVVSIAGEGTADAAEAAEAALSETGFAVLYDDRDERAGVKFADADLIGLPWRVTASPRSLAAGGVEV
jgi:prolyl-tRNA synthetase